MPKPIAAAITLSHDLEAGKPRPDRLEVMREGHLAYAVLARLEPKSISHLFRTTGVVQTEEEMARRGAEQGELSKSELFAVDALGAYGSDHPLMKLINTCLHILIERLENPFLTDGDLESIERAMRTLKTIQTEGIPASYALASTLDERMDVLERYRQEILNLPSEFRPKIPFRVSGAEPLRYAPAVWEALIERRWIQAHSPTKYVASVANNMLDQRQAEDESEHIRAGRSGGTLVPMVDLGADEEPIETLSNPTESVEDLSGLPIPQAIVKCVEMARQGHSWAEIAASLETDTKHLLEKVRRTIDSLPAEAATVLKDRTNYEQFAGQAYTAEIAEIAARLRARATTKRSITNSPAPDPTRATATGQTGTCTHFWLREFNEKSCGNPDSQDTNKV